MKTETIELPGCELLLVKLPEDAHSIEIDNIESVSELYYKAKFGNMGIVSHMHPLGGYWQSLGFAADITEEQWRGIVPRFKSSWGTGYYPEFPLEKRQGNKRTKAGYDRATESGHSLLESKGWYVENPVPKPEIEYDVEGHSHYPLQQYVDEWQSAQSTTNPYILIKRK